MTTTTIAGLRLPDFTTHTAPDPDESSTVPPGSYYRVLHTAAALPTDENTHAWVVRTPTGEWGSLRICDQGAHVDEHEDGTISVLERLITKSGAAWTLHRGQWEESDA